jgi:hypothetical protein
MGLETGTTISQLDSTWPLGGDQKSQGDNHVRLIKSVLKTQFPGAAGLGYNIPILATEADLNALVARASFSVLKNASQAITIGNQTLITWQVEESDNKNAFASNVYTIPANCGGLWLFGLSVDLSAGTTSFDLILRKNSSIAKKCVKFGDNDASWDLITPLVVVAGDVIDSQILISSASLSITSANSRFWGFKII